VTGKLMSLAEAIGRFVPDGASVAIGTCLESLIPFAAGHEIIRQRRRHLTVIGPIFDIVVDQLIGAGCVAKVQAAWVGNVSAGLGHAYRRAAEAGVPRPLAIEDYSNYTVALALWAGAHGLPFVPVRSGPGSDITRGHPGFAQVPSPFDGQPVMVVRALRPDVAILAVQRADPAGHAHAWGNLGITEEAGLAAEHIVVLAEEIVDEAVLTSDPNRVLFPPFLVSAVVHCPGGCHPSPVQGYYGRDHAFYTDYHRATRTVEGMEAWLARWVYEVPDRAAYLARLGEARWQALRRLRPAPAAPVDYGWQEQGQPVSEPAASRTDHDRGAQA
jgi:glutaconate CoA-transferase subunit A